MRRFQRQHAKRPLQWDIFTLTASTLHPLLTLPRPLPGTIPNEDNVNIMFIIMTITVTMTMTMLMAMMMTLMMTLTVLRAHLFLAKGVRVERLP